ncbi:P-loop NTPase fold protein [Acinetobacter sp. TGL-Y2]|uniref:KAP family P-loop NTPase fold protein n=1 Tax=Acinetobacter sp. TGL-Y2 TaxID=1407071 RepID=UPI001904BCEB|nr:P-loop NTPase fold protein [Acinetobacter sp. TGL-Y2]MBJ9370547.1 NTPase [Acinetobacter sp. TGL-Y2]
MTSVNWIKDNDDIQTPFEGDLWNRTRIAEQLENYISRIKVGATVAIDAEWGAGKSWFVKHWKAKLEQNNFKVIYLNAFTQDYIEDPFLTIAMEIANAIEADETSLDKIKSTIGDAYRAILPSLPTLIFQVAMTLIGAGKVVKEFADVVKDLQEDSGKFGEAAAELLNEKLKEHLSAQVDNYENEKNSLDYFKTQLAEITAEQDKPLVFIVDELDRCKPEFAIRLIERIKHFFDIPNVVFVLAVNKKPLEESINSFYGFSSASNYLEKFIDITVLLKASTSNQLNYQNIIKAYIEKLRVSEITQNDCSQLETLCNVYKPNSRQLIRIFNKFALLDNSFKSHELVFLFLMLIYAELKLIDNFNEKELSNHFLNAHENYFKEGFKNFKDRNGSGPMYTLPSFISACIYQEFGLNEFMSYLNFLLYPNSKMGRENSKNLYYPSKPIPKDLVSIWHDYIHLVE